MCLGIGMRCRSSIACNLIPFAVPFEPVLRAAAFLLAVRARADDRRARPRHRRRGPGVSGQAQLCRRLAFAGRRRRSRGNACGCAGARTCAKKATSSSTEPPAFFAVYFNRRASRRDHVALYRRALVSARARRRNRTAKSSAHGFFAPDAFRTTPRAGRGRASPKYWNRSVPPSSGELSKRLRYQSGHSSRVIWSSPSPTAQPSLHARVDCAWAK